MTALLALLLVAAQAPDLRMVYRCTEEIADFGGTGDSLTLTKGFRRDGTPIVFEAVLEDGNSAVATGVTPGTQTRLTLSWKVHYPGPPAAPAWWGWIEIGLLGDARRRVRERGEQWARVLVVRDELLHPYSRPDGGQGLAVSHRGLYLSSELQPLSDRPRSLDMSLEALLVWGSGRERITAYETMVTPARQRGRYRERAIGLERIVGAYEIDMAALGQLSSRVRTAAETWGAGLTDIPGRCEAVPPPEPQEFDIIATDAPSN